MSNGLVETAANVTIAEDTEKDDEDVGALLFCFATCLSSETDEDGNSSQTGLRSVHEVECNLDTEQRLDALQFRGHQCCLSCKFIVRRLSRQGALPAIWCADSNRVWSWSSCPRA